jgi:hypothetical protein
MCGDYLDDWDSKYAYIQDGIPVITFIPKYLSSAPLTEASFYAVFGLDELATGMRRKWNELRGKK